MFSVGLRQNLQIQPAWTQYKHDKLQRSALTSFTQCRSCPQSTTDTETTLEVTSFYAMLFASLSLCIYVSLSLPLPLSLYVCLSVSLPLFFSPSLPPSLPHPLSLSLCIHMHLIFALLLFCTEDADIQMPRSLHLL